MRASWTRVWCYFFCVRFVCYCCCYPHPRARALSRPRQQRASCVGGHGAHRVEWHFLARITIFAGYRRKRCLCGGPPPSPAHAARGQRAPRRVLPAARAARRGGGCGGGRNRGRRKAPARSALAAGKHSSGRAPARCAAAAAAATVGGDLVRGFKSNVFQTSTKRPHLTLRAWLSALAARLGPPAPAVAPAAHCQLARRRRRQAFPPSNRGGQKPHAARLRQYRHNPSVPTA